VVTRAILEEFASAAGLEASSIVVEPLSGCPGDGATVDPERLLYPASMIKTPLVSAALVDVAEGRLHLGDRIEVTERNMTHNDAPSPLTPGYRGTLEELCDLAVTRSDNVATNILFDVVGRERASAIASDRFGLSNTAFYRKLSGSDPLIVDPDWDGVHRNTHPASDAARLFELIALNEVPHADRIRTWLARQEWNDKLSRGLRPGDRFLHKTGSTDDVTHDGGILLTAQGRTYVIVVYAGIASNEENDARFAPFMERLRELL
jgi:beta-lactamase class A